MLISYILFLLLFISLIGLIMLWLCQDYEYCYGEYCLVMIMMTIVFPIGAYSGWKCFITDESFI